MPTDGEAQHLRTADTRAVLEYVDLRTGWRDLQAKTTKAMVLEHPILGFRLGGVGVDLGDPCCWHVLARPPIAITAALVSVASNGLR